MTHLSEPVTHAELIVDLAQLALSATSVPAAVTPMLNTLVTHTSASGAAYFQMQDEQAFFARASSGRMPDAPQMEMILLHGLPTNTPLLDALRRARYPLFYIDTTLAPAAAGFSELGVASLAAAPVKDADNKLIGAFLMHTFLRHEWQPAEVSLFAAVAGVPSSLAARLIAEEQAALAQEGAVRALGVALEQRDDETKGHTDRVTGLALQVAARLELDDAAVKALRWGSYLHDIGKIGIPDAILRKPGSLTDDEWLLMRQHPELGHSFAIKLGFLPQESIEVILSHHERWDGQGYPAGIRTNEVPLLARIFAVCDVYDALTSERPYKPAWAHDKAIAEIRDQAGKQFDPAVVDAFISCVDVTLRRLTPAN